MAITINHNAMAANAYRNLSNTYGKLSTSVQRMSSGLRINSAADDAAGLAIREMMRADIATLQQGLRNAADGISMIQTADGGLAVIDEKLTRMKELAEQASTGTYTTVQREIINSEYQAMAAEIDRIANSTNFNGIKLLDGSVSNQHGGLGIKIHFGASNSAAEDYYFVNIGDARATSSTGLRVGGDAKNDIWGQGAAGSGPLAGPGCCTAGFGSLNGTAGFNSGETFSFGYNWDWQEDDDADLLSGKYLAGRYTVNSSDSLQDLINKVNAGTQARVGIAIDGDALERRVNGASGTVAVCIGDEAYYWGDNEVATGGNRYVQDYKYTVSALNTAGSGLSTIKGVGHDKTYVFSSGIVGSIVSSAGGASNPLMIQGTIKDVDSNDKPTSGEIAGAINKELNETRKSIDGVVTRETVMTSALNSARAEYVVNGTVVNGFNSAAVKAMKADGVISSAAGTASAKIVMTGLYGSSATGASGWTRDADLAAALGWTEISFEVAVAGQSNTAIAGAISTAMKTYGQELVVSPPDDTTLMVNKTEADGEYLKGKAQYEDVELPARTKAFGGIIDSSKYSNTHQIDDNAGSIGGGYNAESLARAINENADSQFWAMTETNADGQQMVYVFAKEGGSTQNSILACEVGGSDADSRAALNAINFENVETGEFNGSGTTLSLGGQKWGTLSPVQTKSNKGYEVWNLTLNGRDVGKERDLWIANPGELTTPGLTEGTINGMDRDSFVEIQNAANADWKGAEVRTQSAAQEALDALTDAIVRKDKIRADLGALQNRLENTMTNQEIQIENLQASESRISDVDVAKEMTEFTKNNVMTQAATSMLAQANSLSQLALSLIG